MGEVLVLLFLSSAMLIGCYMAGMIPLVVSLSEDKLQIVSVLGAGLLVGTALSVIIPEGVNTLYSTQLKQLEALKHIQKEVLTQETVSQAHIPEIRDFEPHSVIGVALVLGFIFMLLIDQISSSHSLHSSAADTCIVHQPQNLPYFLHSFGDPVGTIRPKPQRRCNVAHAIQPQTLIL